MDHKQAKLRTDLDALAGLLVRVEALEQQAAVVKAAAEAAEAIKAAKSAKPAFFAKQEKK